MSDVETVIATEEGVKPVESPTTEKPAEGAVTEPVKEGEVAAKPVEGVKPGESPAPRKHATAEDRIKALWKDGKEKEALLAEKEQKIKALEAEVNKKTTFTAPIPRIENFETTEAFDKAYGDWIDAKLDHKVREQTIQEQAKSAETTAKKAWEPFLENAAKLDDSQYPDLDEAIAGKGVMYSPLSKEFVRNSPVGPQLAYHFYKNPDLALRVAKMNVVEQSQTLIDLQGEFVKASTSKVVTNAPAPIVPLSGGAGSVSKSLDDPTISNAEFNAMRREQVAKRYK